MNPKLLKHLATIKETTEDKLDKESKLYKILETSTEESIFPLLYPIAGLSGAEVLVYASGIGEVARRLSEKNHVYAYEHNEEFKGFAKYVDEEEGAVITWITNDESLKNSRFDVVVFRDLSSKLEEFKKVEPTLKQNGWLLATGPQTKESNDVLNKDNYSLYFFHATKFGFVYLWNKRSVLEKEAVENQNV